MLYDRGMKKTNDVNLIAVRVVEETTEPKESPKPEKNPNAVALGRLGGLKGGKARAAKLSPKKRKEIAQKAARTRWKSEKP
jgi:hypothetical protein